MKYHGVKKRRKNSLERLKKQLSENVKPLKVNGKTLNESVPLTEQDIKRINNEIQILEKQIL